MSTETTFAVSISDHPVKGSDALSDPTGGEPSDPAALGAAGGRRRNEVLSEEELRERFRDRPAIGDLVIDVREYILRVDPVHPFAEFARQMRRDLPEQFGSCTSRALSGKLSNQASKEPSGFSLDVIEAVLSLLVPPEARQAKAWHWADLWELDGRKRPEFRIRPPHPPAPDATPDQPAAPAAPEDFADRDRIIAEQQEELIANSRKIAELIESRERLRAVTASTRRYEVLSTRPPATIENIDASVQMIFAALGVPGYLDGEDDNPPADPRPRLPLKEDLAVTAENWREGGVSANHWTTVIGSLRTLRIIFTVLALIMVMAIVYQVIIGS